MASFWVKTFLVGFTWLKRKILWSLWYSYKWISQLFPSGATVTFRKRYQLCLVIFLPNPRPDFEIQFKKFSSSFHMHGDCLSSCHDFCTLFVGEYYFQGSFLLSSFDRVRVIFWKIWINAGFDLWKARSDWIVDCWYQSKLLSAFSQVSRHGFGLFLVLLMIYQILCLHVVIYR